MAADESSWRWVYLIPMVALMIPIVAILAGTGALDDLEWILVAVVALGGGTLAGRYLIDRGHSHRLAELEARQRIAEIEAAHMREANRLLDRDTEDLRGSLGTSQPSPRSEKLRDAE